MGLVAPVEGPCAWQGQDIANSERWIRDLQPAHIGEIDAALAMVENRGIGWSEITAPDFPLPGLTDLIGQIRIELENVRNSEIPTKFEIPGTVYLFTSDSRNRAQIPTKFRDSGIR